MLRAIALPAVCALGMGLAGCSAKSLGPGQIGRFRPTPVVNVILNSLGVAEETPVAWENARDPQPSDLVAVKADYALQPGDLVRISIFELYLEGVPVVSDYVVSETGKVSVPDVGVIQAAGLTERQLEDQIKQILSPGVLRNPSVTVTLLDSQQRTFSILGNAVARPSRYVIPRSEYRLTDALATAGAQMQFNVSNIYVSRRGEAAAEPADAGRGMTKRRTPETDLFESGTSLKTDNRGQRAVGTGRGNYPSSGIPEPSEPAEKGESEREMLDLIAPHAQSAWPQSTKVVGAVSPKAGQDRATASVLPGGFRVLTQPGRAELPRAASRPGIGNGPAAPPWEPVSSLVEFGTANPVPEKPEAAPVPAAPQPPARTEWIFRDGKWVRVTVAGQGSRTPSAVLPGPRESRSAGLPPTGGKAPAPQAESGRGIEWTLRDGQWAPVPKRELPTLPLPGPPGPATPVGARRPARPEEPKRPVPDQEWEQATQTRLIRIPADKLLAGDPRCNIIIKPGDTIHVPVDLIGEFAITGNVNRSGYIDLTGRPMTLKMAIAAAGGLGPLASPKNVEVIRRIGTAREEIVMVDLDKIASGEQPDFFIKPNDLINVGTDATARKAFRNTACQRTVCGFGYDRHFADLDYGTGARKY